MSGFKTKLDRILLGPFYFQFLNVLRTETQGYKSLLDIGCGFNPALKRVTQSVEHSVGLDAFKPSIDKAKAAGTHSDFILGDVFDHLEKLESNSYDVVMALDLIEHLEKDKGFWLMEQMERIARHKTILFTPNGFVPQRPYDNNPWQEHKSGWDSEEMKTYGYRILGFGGFKQLRGERFAIKYKPRVFWKYVAFYSQLITHKVPRLAYGILCIKSKQR